MSLNQTPLIRKLLTLALLFLLTLGTCRGLVAMQLKELIHTPQPEEVAFSSGLLVLHGFLYKPEGKGPFPAIVNNHGSEKLPGQELPIAKLFVSKGYVVFVPHRRGQGRSSDQGEYIMDLIRREPEKTRGKKFVELQDIHQQDVIAALSYLKQLPYVDQNRIVMSGCSFGGIQTVLATEKPFGLRGTIAFAPAAMSWASYPELRSRP